MNKEKLERARQNLFLGIIASLTLGLAPFYPEPHLFGKVRWVLGGAKGMQAIDWFDLLQHGAPWLFLIWAFYAWWKAKNQK